MSWELAYQWCLKKDKLTSLAKCSFLVTNADSNLGVLFRPQLTSFKWKASPQDTLSWVASSIHTWHDFRDDISLSWDAFAAWYALAHHSLTRSSCSCLLPPGFHDHQNLKCVSQCYQFLCYACLVKLIGLFVTAGLFLSMTSLTLWGTSYCTARHFLSE